MVGNSAHTTVYSDYVCPFCHLGRRSREEYQETRDRALEIEWQPFDLRSQERGPDGEIDHSVDDGKDDAYFEQVRQNVARLKETYVADAMLDLDDLPENGDSFEAQVASFYVNAESPEQWLAFEEAIFEALWIDGRDIGEGDVLADIADETGLDGGEIRTTVAIGGGRLDHYLHRRPAEPNRPRPRRTLRYPVQRTLSVIPNE